MAWVADCCVFHRFHCNHFLSGRINMIMLSPWSFFFLYDILFSWCLSWQASGVPGGLTRAHLVLFYLLFLFFHWLSQNGVWGFTWLTKSDLRPHRRWHSSHSDHTRPIMCLSTELIPFGCSWKKSLTHHFFLGGSHDLFFFFFFFREASWWHSCTYIPPNGLKTFSFLHAYE